MSQKNPLESLDLSGLPEVMRKKVQDQLNRMSPEMQQEFLKKSRPMLNRAMDAAKTLAHDNDPTHKLTSRPKPYGHYNGTIQPGDRGSNSIFKILLLIAVAAIAYQLLD
jgi:hypothetical protein